MRTLIAVFIVLVVSLSPLNAEEPGEKNLKWPERIQAALDVTEPLQYSRGNRLPLYLYSAMNPGKLDDETSEYLVKELDRRGIGLVCSWNPNAREKSLSECLTVARAQKKLGVPVNINATSCVYSFFNGDERTAHIDSQGNPFWDDSLHRKKMGCPYAIDFRKDAIREQVEYFARNYKMPDWK